MNQIKHMQAMNLEFIHSGKETIQDREHEEQRDCKGVKENEELETPHEEKPSLWERRAL